MSQKARLIRSDTVEREHRSSPSLLTPQPSVLWSGVRTGEERKDDVEPRSLVQGMTWSLVAAPAASKLTCACCAKTAHRRRQNRARGEWKASGSYGGTVTRGVRSVSLRSGERRQGMAAGSPLADRARQSPSREKARERAAYHNTTQLDTAHNTVFIVVLSSFFLIPLGSLLITPSFSPLSCYFLPCSLFPCTLSLVPFDARTVRVGEHTQTRTACTRRDNCASHPYWVFITSLLVFVGTWCLIHQCTILCQQPHWPLFLKPHLSSEATAATGAEPLA